MPFAVVEVVAPSTQPITLADAKDHLKVAGTDEDALITTYLAGAVKAAQNESGRQFVTATLKLVLDDFPRSDDDECSAGGSILRLPVGPVQSVTSIAYTDAGGAPQTLASNTYGVGASTGRLIPVNFWPTTYPYGLENVSVSYVAGYGAAASVPADAIAAILLILADRYEHRGDDTAEIHADRPIPAGALRLLRNLGDGQQW